MHIDWTTMLQPDLPLLEMFIRGSLMYLGLFIMLRVILKRQSGNVSIGDMLLIVMIADAAQNGMSSDYQSVSNGLVLVGTLIFWDFTLDWLSYHSPIIARLLEPAPLQLIRNGRILRANLRREMMTEKELLGQLREHGIDAVSQVRCAFMETDGKLSAVKRR